MRVALLATRLAVVIPLVLVSICELAKPIDPCPLFLRVFLRARYAAT
jgi:hypothetical protein